MDETIHQLTTKFLKTLSANLGKTASKSNQINGGEILTDPSLQIILHMISCTRTLREAIETTTGVSTVPNDGSSSVKKPTKNNIHNQLFLPLLNGILALLGKMLMDSFTFEPKVNDVAVFTAAYSVLGRHILNLFPEMATKKHKTSGKMLIHHAVFKARPAIAEDTVGHILRVSPTSARAEDATGALPLHWATRNPDLSFELIDILLKNYPEAPSKMDNKGFLPLHWAVNQDTPNLEIVRKLIKVFPAGPGMPSNSGNLPLHYCVSRAKPSIPVIKALFNAYPEGIRSGCEEGYLPLHRFLNRSIVDLEALRQLINYFPDALLAKSTQRGQTPLHVALDNHVPDALAVELLLQVCPSAAAVMDADKYLPLHQCLDCAEPNYSLALQLLQLHPQAASIVTKEEMLPLHLIVGTNSDPTHEHIHREGNNNNDTTTPNEAIVFVKALLQAYPQALVTTVRDIVPAMDGVALADPESWSGEWVESYWSPLTRARDRGLTGLVQLFLSFQQQQETARVESTKPDTMMQAPPTAATSARVSGSPSASSILPPISLQQPVTEGRPSPVVPLLGLPGSPAITQQKSARGREQGNGSPISEIIPFHQDFRQNTSSAVPVKSQPLNNNNNYNNYSGVNPIRADGAVVTGQRYPGNVGSGDDLDPAADDELPAIGTNRSNKSNRSSRMGRAAPGSRVPPHILKAQNAARASSAGGSQSGDSRASSTERDRERQQRVQQQQYLQQQYQRQQQQPNRQHPQSAWGGNRSTDGSDFGGGELMMESMDLQSYHTQHTALDRGRERDTTPVRQGLGTGSRGQPPARPQSGLGEGSVDSAQSDVSISQLIQNQLARNAEAAAAQNTSNNNNNNKAPPPGPIPASLLEAAENNAQRLARAQLESQTPAGVRKARAAGSSPTKSPYKTSKRNNNNNKNEQQDSIDAAPTRLAATVGASVARRDDAEDSELDHYDKLRMGTAPVYTDRSKFTQPRVVGFGSNSAWSNGEETAEDSTVAPIPSLTPVSTQQDKHNSSEGNLHNPAHNPSNNPALTTKQQRLLQAQQSYMKRSAAGAAKPSNINVVSGTNGTGSNNSSSNNLLPIGLKMKPQQAQQRFPGNEDLSTGPVALKPITIAGSGFSNRSAPSNHTSEVIKNLAAGKIRIHPVKAQANSISTGGGGTGGMDSRADEMV